MRGGWARPGPGLAPGEQQQHRAANRSVPLLRLPASFPLGNEYKVCFASGVVTFVSESQLFFHKGLNRGFEFLYWSSL